MELFFSQIFETSFQIEAAKSGRPMRKVSSVLIRFVILRAAIAMEGRSSGGDNEERPRARLPFMRCAFMNKEADQRDNVDEEHGSENLALILDNLAHEAPVAEQAHQHKAHCASYINPALYFSFVCLSL